MSTQKFRIFLFVFMIAALVITAACKKKTDDNNNDEPEPDPTTVTDIDGNVYNILTIGTQKWMSTNLKVTKYRDGTPIPNVTDGTSWINNTTGAWAYYDNDANNNASYGKLYNYYAVSNTKGLAPTGWHVATEADWNTLITFLGGDAVAGGKLKESGTGHWLAPNLGATNSSGFTALPGGHRFTNGEFYQFNSDCNIWTSTITGTNAKYIYLNFNTAGVYTYDGEKKLGHTVRCVKD